MACRHDVQHITRQGAPYLDRYFLAGWNPTSTEHGPAVFLHHFVASDRPDEFHTHPWRIAVSIILVGGYAEMRCGPEGVESRRYLPGDVNILHPIDRHRIDLIDAECWSLFLTDAYATHWGFHPGC